MTLCGPAPLRLGGVFVARDGGRLSNRRQRIAQLVRERGQELVLAPVGFDQIAFLRLALRDVGEPDREVAFQRRRDDVIPGVIAIGLRLALRLPHFVALERLDVHFEPAAVIPGARHDFEDLASDESVAGDAHDLGGRGIE